MKLGKFETTPKGQVLRLGVYSSDPRHLSEFIRELHAAHELGDAWTIDDSPGPSHIVTVREAAALREKLAELQRWHEQTRMERDKFREDAADQRAKQEWLQRRLRLEESHAKMLYRQIETYQNASHVNRQQREPTVLTFWQWLRGRWS